MHMMELLHAMGDAGRTVLFSSHILEEVEQVSGTVQVIVAGRLAASGDFRTIRRLMTNRPHVFTVRSSDDRRLAVALMAEASVAGVELDPAGGLTVRAGDYGTFTRALPKIALAEQIRVQRLMPADESLESVFSYLVGARDDAAADPDCPTPRRTRRVQPDDRPDHRRGPCSAGAGSCCCCRCRRCWSAWPCCADSLGVDPAGAGVRAGDRRRSASPWCCR